VIKEQRDKKQEEQPDRHFGIVSVPSHLVREEEERLKHEEAKVKKDLRVGASAFERVVKNMMEQAKAHPKRQPKPEPTEEEKERDRTFRRERRDQSDETERSWIQGRKVRLAKTVDYIHFTICLIVDRF
jgi:hypothetical protein